MGEKDVTKKSLEELNDVFADIVNVLLFQGKGLVREKDLEDAGTRSNYTARGKTRSQERDVAKFWHNHEVRIALIGLENQIGEDADMPIRMIGYDGAAYRDQIRRGEKGETKQRYPVISLVLYFGYKHHWQGARTLHECFEIEKELKPYVSNYRMNLFEIAYLSDKQVEMFQSDFKIVADYFVQMRKNRRYKPTEQKIRHVQEILSLMSALMQDDRFEESYQVFQKKRRVTMCEVLDEVEARGRARGIKEGKAEGKAEGIAEGKAKGKAEGEDMLGRLISALLEAGKVDDVKKAATDAKARKRLYKKYGIAQ